MNTNWIFGDFLHVLYEQVGGRMEAAVLPRLHRCLRPTKPKDDWKWNQIGWNYCGSRRVRDFSKFFEICCGKDFFMLYYRAIKAGLFSARGNEYTIYYCNLFQILSDTASTEESS